MAIIFNNEEIEILKKLKDIGILEKDVVDKLNIYFNILIGSKHKSYNFNKLDDFIEMYNQVEVFDIINEIYNHYK